MIQVKKVLYILNPNTYIHCENDVFEVITKMIDSDGVESKKAVNVPALTIEQIVIFGPAIVSDFLVGYCSKHKIPISYVSQYGVYYGRMCGKNVGNVLLRRKQYQMYDSSEKLAIAKNIVLGKAINQKNLLEYMAKSIEERTSQKLSQASQIISGMLGDIAAAKTVDEVRGLEGSIASNYFDQFDNMIKQKSTGMEFEKRSKRPPENNCNALLSFLYTMLTLNCTAALESFGLDSAVGYLHELHPGRDSLSCDLIEEFRAPFVDRFVLTLINRKQVTQKDFESVSGNIQLKEMAKRKILTEWENSKNEKVSFPLYKKDVQRKLIPYLQAQLLAQYIRGDIPEYPPYIWEGD